MEIAPNHFEQYPFVDREDLIEIFKEAVSKIGQKKLSILVYYGIAGIGKTSLRKELPKCFEEFDFKNRHRKVIWTSINLDWEPYRDKNTFLMTLKNDLKKKYKISFPAFEIAYTIYWEKAYPGIPLRKEDYLFFEGEDTFGEFLGAIKQIPYLNLMPKGIRLITGIPDYFEKWLVKKGVELRQLLEKEPQDIEETLPYFWAQDLNNYLEDDKSKSAILFIDTYEALWEKHRLGDHSRDKWIRDNLIPRLEKKILWVIFVRDELRWKDIDSEWDEYLIPCRVDILPRKYCIEYLKTQKITNEDIQKAIFNGSKGVPYYLELCVDMHKFIEKKNKKPKPEDFGANHQKIADKFLKYLDKEKDVLNLLSITHFWDYDLFDYLVKEFNIGYPTNNYENLCSFSVISKDENNRYKMHELMRESLLETQRGKAESKNRIHKAVSKYYSNKLENIDIRAITPEHEIALTEAFYHAKKALKPEDLFKWFIPVSDPFYIAASWQLIVPMYEDLLTILEKEFVSGNQLVATTLNNLADIYENMEDHDKALPLYKKALYINEKALDSKNPDFATTLYNLASIYYRMGEYDNALPYYQKALDIREKMLDSQPLDVAATLNNLALLYHVIGDYEKALPYYQRALGIRKKVLSPQDLDVATTQNSLAGLYKSIKDFDKALSLYQKALDTREKMLGTQHQDFLRTLDNFADLYCQMGDYEKAVPLYKRALDIDEKMQGTQNPEFQRKQKNFALFCRQMGNCKNENFT